MSWAPRETVVVPVDFSDPSLEALDTGLDLVDEAAHVHVIHVLPVLAATEPGVIWDTVDDHGRCEHAKEALTHWLAKDRYQGVTIEAVVGDPGHEVADYAQRVGADLIVLPSHGRTGLRRMLIGSVAERVVRLSHCPVLVMRR